MTEDLQTLEVKSLKVAELKEELAKRGLETKGLKKDVSRLCYGRHMLTLGFDSLPTDCKQLRTSL